MPSLEFKGKQFIYTHHLGVPFRTLEIDPAKSLSRDGVPGLDDNLIIHGDNLHALKALLPTYAGKVKCIYIDPPYNTGTEGWCYNDRVNAPLMREWLKKEANPVDKEDLERHDKWLCMMWPRLQLLRELLADDGVIFASIDHNELQNFLCIMEEIFVHHVATIAVVSNMKGRNDKANVAFAHEYLAVFSKGKWVSYGLPLTDEQKKAFKYEDERGQKYALRDLRKRGSGDRREDRPKMYFPIYYNYEDDSLSLERTLDSDIEIFPLRGDKSEGRWRWGAERVKDYLHILEAKYSKSKDRWDISYRIYLNPDDLPEKEYEDLEEDDDLFEDDGNGYIERSQKSKSFWWGGEISTDTASRELKKIFGGNRIFENAKSPFFLKKILNMATKDNDIILDSFAGTGTTAHAALMLNAEDGGNRKFILVEMEDYADHMTAERVRRVIHGVPNAKDTALKEGLGGSFTYCTLGEEINIASLLRGENVPSYEALARYVFYTATGKTLGDLPKLRRDWFIGETDIYTVHLIYQPDREFLRSQDAALNAEMVDIIADGKGKKAIKKALVFAAVKFMGQKELTERNIAFCQLPYAIHRILGD